MGKSWIFQPRLITGIPKLPLNRNKNMITRLGIEANYAIFQIDNGTPASVPSSQLYLDISYFEAVWLASSGIGNERLSPRWKGARLWFLQHCYWISMDISYLPIGFPYIEPGCAKLLSKLSLKCDYFQASSWGKLPKTVSRTLCLKMLGTPNHMSWLIRMVFRHKWGKKHLNAPHLLNSICI